MQHLTILAYHRIARSGGELAPTLIDAYPEAFEAQMRHIAAHYNVVSSWDLVRALRDGFTLPGRALIITFDDGYRCFAEIAMPVLRRLGLPVTLFIPTAFPGEPGRLFWWDELYRALHLAALKSNKARDPQGKLLQYGPLTPETVLTVYEALVMQLERMPEDDARRALDALLVECEVETNREAHMLGWDELCALAAEGVAIGPHTRNHTILSTLTPERVRAEVEGSWADLQARIMEPLPIFCYPNGQPHAISRVAIHAVREAGMAGAYTMVGGLNLVGKTSPYRLHRLGAVGGESLARFRFKIGAGGEVYRRLKRLVKRQV